MNIINLTPHNINIFRRGPSCYEEMLSIPPSGNIARLSVERKITAFIPKANGQKLDPEDGLWGLPLVKSIFGEASKLPPMKQDTIYIVSSLFRSKCDRADLYVPGKLLWDNDGKQPIGYFGLSR